MSAIDCSPAILQNEKTGYIAVNISRYEVFISF